MPAVAACARRDPGRQGGRQDFLLLTFNHADPANPYSRSMAVERANLPGHIAIIMDGNGRWAMGRGLPRVAGHRAGVVALRKLVEHCVRRGVRVLTVFAFSSENWNRPDEEVGLLFELFLTALDEQVAALHENGVRLCFIGEREAFPGKLQAALAAAEARTGGNDRLTLVVAVNYGGRRDIVRACARLVEQAADGRAATSAVNESSLGQQLGTAGLPDPDLFIRTGGEQRFSNFLLWELAYTELYFSTINWPDFGPARLDEALEWYAGRQRRFGRTSEQIEAPGDA